MGHVLMVIFSLVFALFVIASGAGKFRRAPQVMAAMRHVGIQRPMVAIIATIEVVAGVGLLIGLVSAQLGETCACILTVYFLGMILAHRRAGDRPARYRPLIWILVLSVVTTIFQFVR